MAGKKIELYSKQYYATCALGGVMSCGLTHAVLTPLDALKCRVQAMPKEYPSIGAGLKKTLATEGAMGLTVGWAPTLIGYSMQGLCKFGFYELFKKKFADAAGDNFEKFQSPIYLAASSSAEVIADCALAPMEAVKVRMQTDMKFPRTLGAAMRQMHAEEGMNAFYKGLVPLMSRQVPYTAVKFAVFEKVVNQVYKALGATPDEFSKTQKLGVTFTSGYIAGIFCAIVSQPADNIVSQMNSVENRGKGAGELLKKMGVFNAFTRGLGPRLVMIGSLTGLQWLIFDSVKVAFGLPASGKAAKKEE